MFSNQDLRKLIIPLIIEQFLGILVGMLDIVMISSVGETAVSGVSLVDSINTLLILVFSALATGGAVVASQYLGKGDHKRMLKSAYQLFLTVFTIAMVLTAFFVLFRKPLLHLIFGKVEQKIMDYALIYFFFTALSYPFLALYNAGAALFRAMGNSKVSMKVSMVMNIMNIIGNAFCIYGLHMGSEGVAIPTLISRIAGAVIVMTLLKNKAHPIYVDRYLKFDPDPKMIRRILSIGVPSGLENGMFQFGKIILTSLISTFGTVAIAANAVAGTIAVLQISIGSACGIAIVTVVGQCIGAGEDEQAVYYSKKILKWTYVMAGIFIAALILSSPLINRLYHLSAETGALASQLYILHGVCAILIWPISFTLPNVFRASNDARFAMIVSIISMWSVRIVMSYILGRYLGFGVMGVWIAMILDWVIRSVVFVYHFHNRKWLLQEHF